MFTFYIYCFIIPNFVSLTDFKRYIHYRLDGNMGNEHGMNFTVFITNFTGVVIYSLDKNNKFLMELENGEKSKRVVFKFKEFHKNIDSIKLCSCRKCEGILIAVTLKLRYSSVHIDCNGVKHSISFYGGVKWPDQFTGYPIPIGFNSETNKTFIWMGNLGPYHGYKDVLYLPIRNQLMGCMKSLYFENQLVEESKTKCKTFTDIKPNQICSFLRLENSKNIEYYFDNKIKLYPPQSHNYNKFDISTFGFPIKIEWCLEFQKANQIFSLVKILLNNNSSISVKINSNFKITINMEKYKLIQCSKEFNLVKNYQTKSIIIDFIKNQLKIFIKDTELYNTIEDEIFLTPIDVNIAKNESIDEDINGTITFHYNWRHFTTTQSPDQMPQMESDDYWIYIPLAILLLILLFALIIILSKKSHCKLYDYIFTKFNILISISSQMYTESTCYEKRQQNVGNISLPMMDPEIYDVITNND